ncbi:hypothetical protein AB6A40_009554 [Gnathostoma spinigerum]|uniref:Tudor domain-containing protein n=1 Tax=Gnathostoma spinigerum TaxID=75299 RepID=A0ABD6F1S5_9BILA
MLENSVLREEPCPSPSTIMKTFASGPEHLMVMIIALLAKMYDWPVAKDIEEHWDEIEEHPISTDDEYMESLTDFSKYSHEIFSDLCPPDLLDTSIESAVVCDTAAIDESVRYCESACAQLWKSVEILRNKVSQLLIEPDERIQCVDSEPNSSDEFQNQSCEETRRLYSEPRENSDGDDIHIVDVKTTDCYQMKANDPENLDEIPIGIMCLMRQIENSNFVRCQVVEKISSREYSAMLHDGREEIVDISRLARIRSIHLRCWEGVRVCALYEPKLDPHHQKAFYAGIVAVGPQHLSHDECLVFFDIGRDGFVAMRNVFVLAEQMYRKDSVAKTIDRVNNWQLVPKSRQRFIRYYLHQYPDWPLVPMKRKQNTQRVNVNRNGIPHSAFVLTTDRHLALLRFPRGSQLERNCVVIGCNRHVHDDEWIYRGSDRLQPIQAMILNLEKQRAALTGYGSNGPKFLSSRRSRRESRFVQSLEYSANKSRGLHTSLHANNGSQSWQPNDNSVYSVFSNDNDNDDEVCFIRQHAAYKALHSSQTIARSCSDSSLIRGSRKSRVFVSPFLRQQEIM